MMVPGGSHVRTAALFLLTAAAYAAEIPTGSHVLLRLQSSVNTRSAQPGDFVYFTTTTPISSENKIVVPAGSYVQGVVLGTDRGGRVKGRAQMGIRLETLTLPSGQQYKITPRVASTEGDNTTQRVIDREGTIGQGSSVESDIARTATFAGSGAVIGLFVGNWGNNVTRSAGHYAASAGIGAGVGAAVGVATAMFTRGKDVELRQGAGIDIVFDRPVDLQ
jgi:type IV secretion system protein VirB10